MAASVILLRGHEVYLVRRHARSSFMRLAFVFPGGGVDPSDGSAEQAAIRVLLKETGVLLCDGLPSPARLESLRAAQAAGRMPLADLLAREGICADPSKLRFWARWVTPSVEPKRFDAAFFVAQLPQGQVPRIDGRELIDDRWMTPAEALHAHQCGAIQLPPPQIRMLFELDIAIGAGPAAWEATLERRRDPQARVMPRFALTGIEQRHSLLLPWDPGYDLEGTGEGFKLAEGHPWAWGPSRFVLDGEVWRLQDAPAARAEP